MDLGTALVTTIGMYKSSVCTEILWSAVKISKIMHCRVVMLWLYSLQDHLFQWQLKTGLLPISAWSAEKYNQFMYVSIVIDLS